MHNDQKIAGWVEDELEIRRGENDGESPESEHYEPGLFLNVLANNIDELLGDKQLTFDLARYFRERGLTGEKWQITVMGIGMQMSRDQLPVLLWLNEAEKAFPAVTLKI